MIELKNLWVYYGRLLAVHGISFLVPEGSICAMIGPNGAGKTSTMRVLSTLLRPAAGTAAIAGHDVLREPLEVRRVLGFVPDGHGVYENLSVEEYLDFFAATYGFPPGERKRIVEFSLELTDMGTLRARLTGSLSRGMRQRLSLARALVHDPKVLILDEPASGLDPRARIEFRALLKELQQMGKTLLISSHILTEMEEVCDSIVVIEKGKLVACGRIDEIRRSLAPMPTAEIELLEPPGGDQVALLHSVPNLRNIEIDGRKARFQIEGGRAEMAHAVRMLVTGGVSVVAAKMLEEDLENLYMRLTKGEVH